MTIRLPLSTKLLCVILSIAILAVSLPLSAIALDKVFATYDGGATWTVLKLTLPEKYDPYDFAVAYFPYFEGDRGIIFVGLSGDVEDCVCCYLTEDGGRTWTLLE